MGVQAMEGGTWSVGRVWVEREAPHWRRFETAHLNRYLLADTVGSVELAATVALCALAVALLAVTLVLLGVEPALIGTGVAVAALAWTLHGRQWLVRAERLGDGELELIWRVAGWRRSGRVAGEVTSALAAGTMPQPAGPIEDFVIARRAQVESTRVIEPTAAALVPRRAV